MLWSNIFQNLALFWVKNANFFAKFFGKNILKIITSVPDLHLSYFIPNTNKLLFWFTSMCFVTFLWYAFYIWILKRQPTWGSLTKLPFMNVSYSRTEWPDWANFRLLGDWLIESVFRKLQKRPQILASSYHV
jgi:hypothetical protein